MPPTEPWTCPLCERKFKVPPGSTLKACPDCQKKPTLTRRAESPQSDGWFIQYNGESEVHGPLPLSQVRDLYFRGDLKETDFACRRRGEPLLSVEVTPEITAVYFPIIPVVTTETLTIQGLEITEHLPAVFSRRVFAYNVLAELITGSVDLKSKQLPLEQRIAKIEKDLVTGLCHQASLSKADGIVGARFQFGNLSSGKSTIIYGFAQGTPVRMKDIQ